MTERGTHSDQLILHLQTLKHCDWRTTSSSRKTNQFQSESQGGGTSGAEFCYLNGI